MSPQVWVRICYLCHQKGELKEAVAYYVSKPLSPFHPKKHIDVCVDCKKIVEKEGFEVTELNYCEIVQEKDGVFQ